MGIVLVILVGLYVWGNDRLKQDDTPTQATSTASADPDTVEAFENWWNSWSAEGQATICRGVEIDGSAAKYLSDDDYIIANPTPEQSATFARLLESKC